MGFLVTNSVNVEGPPYNLLLFPPPLPLCESLSTRLSSRWMQINRSSKISFVAFTLTSRHRLPSFNGIRFHVSCHTTSQDGPPSFNNSLQNLLKASIRYKKHCHKAKKIWFCKIHLNTEEVKYDLEDWFSFYHKNKLFYYKNSRELFQIYLTFVNSEK